MQEYHPDKFASLFRSPLGKKLWTFLTRLDVIARLETASELGKPAVEGIEGPLLQDFGGDVLVDRVKQMIGHMVRQVLEYRGWVVDQGEVKIQSIPFIKATRYRRPDSYLLHVFRNASDPRDVVMTDTRQRPRLPAGEWVYYCSFNSPLKGAIAFGLKDLQQVKARIRTHGYHSVRVPRMLRAA